MNAVEFLSYSVPDAPQPMNRLEMYERALNMMIGVGTGLGCAGFAATPPIDRVAAHAGSLMSNLFDEEEKACILACAIDRLSELALNGAAAYRYNGDELPEPK